MILFVALIIEIGIGVNGWADTTGDILSPGVMIINIRMGDKGSTIEQIKIQHGTCNPIRQESKVSLLPGPLNKSKLEVIDKEGHILYEMQFAYPKLITVPMLPPGDPGDNVPSVVPIDNPRVSLVIPYFPKADSIHVFDGSEKTASPSKSIQDAELEDNLNYLTPPIPVPSQPGMFNVVIIASGYNSSNITNFQSKAESIKNTLLNTEPFKTYASQINVNIYNNSADLGCYTGCFNIDRLLCCNRSSVVSAAAASGYYYDEIIVIHNTSVYAGGGYRENLDAYKINSYNTYCAVYDGYYSDVMALHEFGHSFGNLCDEYSYGSEGYSYNDCVNCRSNCNDWSNTGSTECQQGCDAETSYYRPEDSIMLTLAIEYFNLASTYATYLPDGLQERLAYFITSTTTPTVTTMAVSSVTSNSASSGGDVTSEGGASVTARGVCWSTSANPTTSGSKTTDSTGTGSFTSSITGLTPVTTYHVRAYATNSAGTSYGSDQTFTTTSSGMDFLYVSSDGTCGGNTPCYITIQEAIDAADGSVIKILQGTYDEDIIIDQPYSLTLSGGWDSTFTTQSSNTVFNSLTINGTSGTVEVDNIVLQETD